MALVVAAALAGAVCLSGLGIAYVAYDRATKPDRGTPGVAVRQYLQAVFEGDDARTSLFTCRKSDLGEVAQLRSDMKAREERFNATIVVSWENLVAAGDDERAVVTADLRLTATVNGSMQREIQRWEFRTAHESGWRVCDGRRID